MPVRGARRMAQSRQSLYGAVLFALPALLSCRDKDQRAERGKASHPAGKRAYSASTLAVPTCSAGEPTLTVTFPGVFVRTMATARPSKAWQRAEVY